nr:hypothetical protein Iba_chr13aCG5470 [Ipomoea batatas]
MMSNTTIKVFGPEEHPKSAMDMVSGQRLLYTSVMASSVVGFVQNDIEHPRVHPDMPPNVPPSDTVHNDISVNNNRDMSMPAEHSLTHTSNSEHTSVAQPRRSTRIHDIEHPRVHPDMPPNVPPSDTVHNDISVNNNRDMSHAS